MSESTSDSFWPAAKKAAGWLAVVVPIFSLLFGYIYERAFFSDYIDISGYAGITYYVTAPLRAPLGTVLWSAVCVSVAAVNLFLFLKSSGDSKREQLIGLATLLAVLWYTHDRITKGAKSASADLEPVVVELDGQELEYFRIGRIDSHMFLCDPRTGMVVVLNSGKLEERRDSPGCKAAIERRK